MAIVALVCAWGCSFQEGSYGVSIGDPASAPDAGMGSGAGSGSATATPDGQPSTTRTCAFADPDLRLCLDFEDHSFVPRATDASLMHLDATTHDISETARSGSVAALVSVVSGIQVPEATALDFTDALTLELWVRPAYDQYALLVENLKQYSVMLTSDHRAGCALPGGSIQTETDKVATGSWSHIACTFGPTGKLLLYVNGQLKASTTLSGTATSGAGTTGTRIGAGYGGRVDDVKMYARELTPDEICAHSGHSNCTE